MSEVVGVPIMVSDAHQPSGGFEARTFVADGHVPAHQAASRNQARETLEQAFARGFSEGGDHAASEFASERARWQALVASSAALQPDPSDELAALIADAVTGLAQSVIGRAPIDQEWLIARAHEAAAIIADCDAARTIWVHPDDAPLLADASLALEIHADPDAAPGSIRTACSSGWIEHGRSLFIEQIDAMRVTR
jgi:flagellar assembly protein FliH